MWVHNASQSMWWLFVISFGWIGCAREKNSVSLDVLDVTRHDFVKVLRRTFSICFSCIRFVVLIFTTRMTTELWKWYTNRWTHSHCAASMQFNYKCQSNNGQFFSSFFITGNVTSFSYLCMIYIDWLLLLFFLVCIYHTFTRIWRIDQFWVLPIFFVCPFHAFSL